MPLMIEKGDFDKLSNEEKMLYIQETIKQLFEQLAPEFAWFLTVIDKDSMGILCGDDCAVCVYNRLGNFIEDNNIEHSIKETSERIM